MLGKDKERWMELCEQAAVEQDPERLLSLVNEIVALPDAKQERLDPRKNRVTKRPSKSA